MDEIVHQPDHCDDTGCLRSFEFAALDFQHRKNEDREGNRCAAVDDHGKIRVIARKRAAHQVKPREPRNEHREHPQNDRRDQPQRGEPAAAPRVASPGRGPRSLSGPPGAEGSLDELLREAVAAGASDIHIHSGAPIKLRRWRKIYDHGSQPLSEDDARKLVYQSLGEADRARFEEHGEHDYCHEIEGVGRFRANAYRQLRGIDAVFRHIPANPPSLDDLGLPHSLAKLTAYHQGLVLLTGPTGPLSGTSSDTTNGLGNYNFTNLLPGEYTVMINNLTVAVGVVSGTQLAATTAVSSTLTIISGDVITNVDFGYATTGTVSGNADR